MSSHSQSSFLFSSDLSLSLSSSSSSTSTLTNDVIVVDGSNANRTEVTEQEAKRAKAGPGRDLSDCWKELNHTTSSKKIMDLLISSTLMGHEQLYNTFLLKVANDSPI
jgi:hypothetical protein